MVYTGAMLGGGWFYRKTRREIVPGSVLFLYVAYKHFGATIFK